jgi:superfamily II DNA or RNA helicase
MVLHDVFQPVFQNKFRQFSFAAIESKHSNEFLLRGWQSEAAKIQNGEKYTITNVLMGGGKTIYAQHLGLELRENNPDIKLIYIVPQTHIGLSFSGRDKEGNDHGMDINGRFWQVDKFLCDGDNSNGQQFIEFFQDHVGGILVCTHATLVLNWRNIQEYVNSNLHIFVDEAHHISGEEDQTNELGNFCRFAVENGAGLHLMTATFYRGDKYPIIPNKYSEQFNKYVLPIDEYMSKYIRSFNSFNYQFGFAVDPEFGNYAKQVGQMLKGNKKKTIVFIPHVACNWVQDKYQESKQIIEGIVGTKIKNLKEDADGIIRIGGKSFINLVDESNRDAKKKTMGDGKNLDVDYIIALGMFKEGSNWTHCEKIVICGPRNSLVETVQIIGRCLRDLDKGTKEPEIIQILAKPSQKLDEPKLKEWVNDNLCYIGVSLLMELIFDAPKLKKTDVKSIAAKTYINNSSNRNFIADAANGDDAKTQNLMKELCIIRINSDSRDEFIEKASDFVKESYGEEFAELAAAQYWKLHERRDKIFSKRSIKEVSDHVNMVDEESDGWMANITSEVGLMKFSEIREILSYGEKASLEEHIKFARDNNIDNHTKWEEMSRKGDVPVKFYQGFRQYKPEWLNIIWPNRKKDTPLSTGQIQHIIKLFKQGITRFEISKKLSVSYSTIQNLLDKSGLKKIEPRVSNFIGNKFNKLTVVEKDKSKKNHYVICQCDCGGIKSVKLSNLKNGSVKSCGCMAKNNNAKLFKIITPDGEVVEGENITEYSKSHGFHSILIKRDKKSKGYCLYHPNLVGTTHQERLDKGLYKKYLTLKK